MKFLILSTTIYLLFQYDHAAYAQEKNMPGNYCTITHPEIDREAKKDPRYSFGSLGNSEVYSEAEDKILAKCKAGDVLVAYYLNFAELSAATWCDFNFPFQILKVTHDSGKESFICIYLGNRRRSH